MLEDYFDKLLKRLKELSKNKRAIFAASCAERLIPGYVEFSKKQNRQMILVGRAGLLGEYIGVTASSLDDIHPIWTDTRLGNQDVFVGVKDTVATHVVEYLNEQINGPTLFILPNPAKEYVFIKINMQQGIKSSDIVLQIYDITGQEIKTFNYPQDQNIWNRRDNAGNSVGRGVYFCTLKSNGFFTVRKFILL